VTEVAVLNAGGWGTALACVLAGRGRAVTLWARRPELAVELTRLRENPAYLPGVALPAGVTPTADLAAAIESAPVIVVAAPMRGLRVLARQLAPLLDPRVHLLVGTKGLELDTWLRPSEVLAAELGESVQNRLAVLAGPNHAEEVARGLPTAAVLACPVDAVARALQETVTTSHFRLYTASDVVGLELCAAAKNVIAIAAGVADGLGGGDNGKAALITRSLAELGRLVAAHGGDPATVTGLAGIGDLIATCTSPHSRNRWTGEQLGRGRPLSDILGSTPMVVEGVPATRGVIALARAASVDLPICEAVQRVLYEGQPPRDAILDLLTRPLTTESSPRPL
jgi:glycerol-3-phosphate dehydrogenase (NAD(P)+)